MAAVPPDHTAKPADMQFCCIVYMDTGHRMLCISKQASYVVRPGCEVIVVVGDRRCCRGDGAAKCKEIQYVISYVAYLILFRTSCGTVFS